MTTNKLQLGRFKAAEVYRRAKLAGLGAIGGVLDNVLGGGAKAIAKHFANGSGLTRLGMGLGGVAGASAINEGLSRFGGPSISFDGDRQWSPEMQGVRNYNNSGMFGQMGEFFKRPIQYMTSTNSIPTPNEALRANGSKIPDSAIAGYSFDSDGNPVVRLNGNMHSPFSSSYEKYLKTTRQQNHNLRGFGNNNNSNGNGNNSGQRQDFRYGDNTLSVPNVF